ncbi:50S ribosomal protein L20 [Patescibacteria group bacterium]|nr:50S ribosomal protein L20 [Patescibacteria group bacterium]
MARVKGGVTALKRRRSILAQTKGYRFGRSTKKRAAHDAIVHAQLHAFAHRKDKKNDFRRLWIVRLNAALRTAGTTYSKFINMLKVKGVVLDRKSLSEIAHNRPETFARILKSVS